MSLISVIIPTKNRSEEIKRAIKSVLSQTNQDFEILVIDDHSDEDIESVTLGFKDDRIRYFKSNKQPSNANVCRNIGIDNAQGEYIAMLDSDDEWMPEHLELGVGYLVKNNLDGVFGGFINNNGTELRQRRSRERGCNENFVNYLLSGGVAVTPSHIYKTSCCKKIKWDEELLRHQDFDYSVRFSKHFKFDSYTHITTIVHAVKGERRTEHFESLIKFIRHNKHDISPGNYATYHKNMYNAIKDRNDISAVIRNHYKVEMLKYIHLITLTDYLMIFGNNKSKMGRFILRIKFLFKLLIKH